MPHLPPLPLATSCSSTFTPPPRLCLPSNPFLITIFSSFQSSSFSLFLTLFSSHPHLPFSYAYSPFFFSPLLFFLYRTLFVLFSVFPFLFPLLVVSLLAKPHLFILVLLEFRFSLITPFSFLLSPFYTSQVSPFLPSFCLPRLTCRWPGPSLAPSASCTGWGGSGCRPGSL